MLNICVFNMRCTNDDSRSFSVLCLQKLSLDKSAVHHCIISVRRMKTNNRHNNVGRPGPLIIRFSWAECKSDLLNKNAHKLSNLYEQGSILKIFITHDLAQKQQAKKTSCALSSCEGDKKGKGFFFGEVKFTRLTTASLSVPPPPPHLLRPPHRLPYPAQSWYRLLSPTDLLVRIKHHPLPQSSTHSTIAFTKH